MGGLDERVGAWVGGGGRHCSKFDQSTRCEIVMGDEE